MWLKHLISFGQGVSFIFIQRRVQTRQYLRFVNCLCARYFTLECAFWERVPSFDWNCPLNLQFITSRWRLTDSVYHAATYGKAHVLTLVLQSTIYHKKCSVSSKYYEYYSIRHVILYPKMTADIKTAIPWILTFVLPWTVAREPSMRTTCFCAPPIPLVAMEMTCCCDPNCWTNLKHATEL